MFKLETDCVKCEHEKICRFKNNARSAFDVLKSTTYKGTASNYSCDWEAMMERNNVDVIFSCPDFKRKQEYVLRQKD